MRLSDIEIERLIPAFMRDDKNFKAIIYAITPEFQQLYTATRLIELFTNIDSLPEDILDELAWHFNVIEYNKEYGIEVKRSLIKTCLLTHHQRGTVAAVEETGTKIFGDARVEEWFDYEDGNGQPYHFKVYTSNITTSEDMIAEFTRMVVSTQNIRSHLDEIVAETINEMALYVGSEIFVQGIAELSTETYVMPNINTTSMFYVNDGDFYFNIDEYEALNLKDQTTGTVYLVTHNNAGQVVLTEVSSTDSIDVVQVLDSTTDDKYLMYVSNGRVYYNHI